MMIMIVNSVVNMLILLLLFGLLILDIYYSYKRCEKLDKVLKMYNKK